MQRRCSSHLAHIQRPVSRKLINHYALPVLAWSSRRQANRIPARWASIHFRRADTNANRPVHSKCAHQESNSRSRIADSVWKACCRIWSSVGRAILPCALDLCSGLYFTTFYVFDAGAANGTITPWGARVADPGCHVQFCYAAAGRRGLFHDGLQTNRPPTVLGHRCTMSLFRRRYRH